VTVNVRGADTTSYQLEGLHPHSSYVVTVAAKTNTVGQPQKLDIKTDTGVPKGESWACARTLQPVKAWGRNDDN
jgi:hypothetical protein